MSVKIRLQRFGVCKKPYYRIVASNSKSSRDGKFLEILGNYEPILGKINVDEQKVQKWLSQGAQKTEIVNSLLKKVNKEKKLSK